MYLKWQDCTVGIFDKKYNLKIVNDKLTPVRINFNEKYVPRHYVENFFRERIPSKNRKDINETLERLGLKDYDVMGIAKITKGFNLMDKFWVSFSEDERYKDVTYESWNEMLYSDDNKIFSPCGATPKEYTNNNGKIGITKYRGLNESNDLEMEIAVHRVGKLLGVLCCPVWQTGKDKIFSEFVYNINNQYITHASRYFEKYHRSRNLYADLMDIMPQHKQSIDEMLVLDFVTRQEERTLDNFAIVSNKWFYPLYDNGKSLFYKDSEKSINKMLENIESNCPTFGKEGTYLNYIKEIDLNSLKLNLEIPRARLLGCFDSLNVPEYRKQGAIDWMLKCLSILQNLRDN